MFSFDKKQQGCRLRTFREDYLKMKQSEFSQSILNMEQAALSKIETGERSVSYGVIEDMSKWILKEKKQVMNLNWLLFGIGDFFISQEELKKFTNTPTVNIHSGNGDITVVKQIHNQGLDNSYLEIMQQKNEEIEKLKEQNAELRGQVKLLRELLEKK